MVDIEGDKMTAQEIASQTVDKYWKVSGFSEPNPYLLEADIAQALESMRREENEACAKVAEDSPKAEFTRKELNRETFSFDNDSMVTATAIRTRLTQSKERE